MLVTCRQTIFNDILLTWHFDDMSSKWHQWGWGRWGVGRLFPHWGFLLCPYVKSYVADNLILQLSLFNSLSISISCQCTKCLCFTKDMLITCHQNIFNEILLTWHFDDVSSKCHQWHISAMTFWWHVIKVSLTTYCQHVIHVRKTKCLLSVFFDMSFGMFGRHFLPNVGPTFSTSNMSAHVRRTCHLGGIGNMTELRHSH
jgi:hypothetical protein